MFSKDNVVGVVGIIMGDILSNIVGKIVSEVVSDVVGNIPAQGKCHLKIVDDTVVDTIRL